MRKRTSSSGRRQFSVENAYTVSHAQPELERALDRVEERLLPRGVALGALEAALLRPPPVAVHDERHVARDAAGSSSAGGHARNLSERARYRPRGCAAGTIPAHALDGAREPGRRPWARPARLLPRCAEALPARGARRSRVARSRRADGLARSAAARSTAATAWSRAAATAPSRALAGVAAEHDGVARGRAQRRRATTSPAHFGIDGRRPLDARSRRSSRPASRAGDLGRAKAADGTDCWFTTVANTGFDAEANRWANTVQWATGTPLYVAAVLRTLAVYRPRAIRIMVDGDTWEDPAWLVAVGNTRYYASGMMITPERRRRRRAARRLRHRCRSRPRRVPASTFPGCSAAPTSHHPQVSPPRAGRRGADGRRGPQLDVYASGEHVGPLPAPLEAIPARSGSWCRRRAT